MPPDAPAVRAVRAVGSGWAEPLPPKGSRQLSRRARRRARSAWRVPMPLVIVISVAVGVVESDGAFGVTALFETGVAALSDRFLGTRIGVGTVDFLTLLVVVAWSARQLHLMWRAERSPEIEVSAIGGEGVTANQVTALADRLRRYLSEVSVGPPPAVPGTNRRRLPRHTERPATQRRRRADRSVPHCGQTLGALKRPPPAGSGRP